MNSKLNFNYTRKSNLFENLFYYKNKPGISSNIQSTLDNNKNNTSNFSNFSVSVDKSKIAKNSFFSNNASNTLEDKLKSPQSISNINNSTTDNTLNTFNFMDKILYNKNRSSSKTNSNSFIVTNKIPESLLSSQTSQINLNVNSKISDNNSSNNEKKVIPTYNKLINIDEEYKLTKYPNNNNQNNQLYKYSNYSDKDKDKDRDFNFDNKDLKDYKQISKKDKNQMNLIEQKTIPFKKQINDIISEPVISKLPGNIHIRINDNIKEEIDENIDDIDDIDDNIDIIHKNKSDSINNFYNKILEDDKSIPSTSQIASKNLLLSIESTISNEKFNKSNKSLSNLVKVKNKKEFNSPITINSNKDQRNQTLYQGASDMMKIFNSKNVNNLFISSSNSKKNIKSDSNNKLLSNNRTRLSITQLTTLKFSLRINFLFFSAK